MTEGIVEIVGGFLIFVGLCTLVAGAAMVSAVLAVLVAGALVVLVGVVALYVAIALERAKVGRASKAPGQP